MKLLLMCTLICTGVQAAMAQQNYLVVGTYTGSNSPSTGIYVYDFNTGDANSRLVDSAAISNPSFLAVAPNQQYLYSVREEANAQHNGGSIAAFSFNRQNGSLQQLNQQPSKGNHPCYVAVHKNGRWVMAGNYSSGSLAVLPVAKDGSLLPAVASITHTGSSANSSRQKEPHVHATVFSPDGRFLLVPDLGTDKLMIYRFNRRTGALQSATTPFVASNPGAGPRHLDFHPRKKWVYLVEELTGTVAAYRYHARSGALSLLQNISTLPAGFTGFAGSADIHASPDGKFLYASNRGQSNTIAIYSIAERTGHLSLVGHQSTLGKAPRNFNFDPTGNWLLVANQDSNEIVVFKIDKATGLLTDSDKRIAVGKPVCLKWVR